MQRNHRKENNKFYSKKNNQNDLKIARKNNIDQHRKSQIRQNKNIELINTPVEITPYIPMFLTFNFNNSKHRLIFFLFVFNRLTPVYAAKTTEEMVSEKMFFNKNVPQEKCLQLQNDIIETIEMDGFDNEYIKYVLNEKKLSLICTNPGQTSAPDAIAQFDGGLINNLGVQRMAFFQPGVNNPSAIRHEFYHAHNFFYH